MLPPIPPHGGKKRRPPSQHENTVIKVSSSPPAPGPVAVMTRTGSMPRHTLYSLLSLEIVYAGKGKKSREKTLRPTLGAAIGRLPGPSPELFEQSALSRQISGAQWDAPTVKREVFLIQRGQPDILGDPLHTRHGFAVPPSPGRRGLLIQIFGTSQRVSRE